MKKIVLIIIITAIVCLLFAYVLTNSNYTINYDYKYGYACSVEDIDMYAIDKCSWDNTTPTYHYVHMIKTNGGECIRTQNFTNNLSLFQDTVHNHDDESTIPIRCERVI